ncbi:MAG: shikimate dehydrogenase [Oscillospiraceae bacterium]
MDYKFGLIAKGIKNSVTPLVYEAFGKDLGMNVSFEIFNVEEDKFEETVKFTRGHLNGFNVTMPYKVRMLDFVDELDESAERCGSTNVVLVKDGKLIAYNTDGWGMIKALQLKGFSFKDKKVVMVGAGGVALSIAYNLLVNDVAEVSVLNIFSEEAERLCSRFGEKFTPHPLENSELCRCCEGADFFINASVLGQLGYDDYTSFDFLDSLASGAVVFDVNYSNPNAKLPAAGREKGLHSFVGRSMTACQGIRAMEIWTGSVPSDTSAKQLVYRFENELK